MQKALERLTAAEEHTVLGIFVVISVAATAALYWHMRGRMR